MNRKHQDGAVCSYCNYELKKERPDGFLMSLFWKWGLLGGPPQVLLSMMEKRAGMFATC